MSDFTCMRTGGNPQASESHKLFREREFRRFLRWSLTAVLWSFASAGTAAGQLPPGGRVTQIKPAHARPVAASLNNNREVVFYARTIIDVGWRSELYRFFDGTLEQITSDEFKHFDPDVNDLGWITWARTSTEQEDDGEIVLLRGESVEVLTDTPQSEVLSRINNHGQMVWEQWSLDHRRKEIFFFDPEVGDSVMITDEDPQVFNLAPGISDTGDAVWRQIESPLPGASGGPDRVMHYSKGETRAISDGLGRGERSLSTPVISENGDVYWADDLGSPAGPIFRWRDGRITEVVPYGSPAAANARGDLLFRQGANQGMSWLYRNGVYYQAFGGITGIAAGDMNANGDAAGRGYAEAPRDIFFLTIDPIPGDHDEDGDLDIDDLAGLADCLAGPGEGLRDESCARVDFNGDAHVDLRDVAAFGTGFTGDCALGITTPPGGEGFCVGDEINLSIDVRGRVASYQWTYERELIPGATDPNYVIPRAEVEDTGEYGVILTSECGWESRSDKRHHVTVHRDPPAISIDDPTQEACRGQDIIFWTSLGGRGQERYWFNAFQWQKDGVNMPGENWRSLVVRDVDEDDVGEYRLVATNACGVTESREATLTLAPDDAPPRILLQPRDLTVDPGEPASFNVLAACTDSYQWKKEGENLPGETRSDLFIFPVTCDHAGEYTVTVINTHGQVTSDPVQLTVNNCP